MLTTFGSPTFSRNLVDCFIEVILSDFDAIGVADGFDPQLDPFFG